MDSDPLLNQDVLKTRLMAFLADHFEQWFTIEELANEQPISGSIDDIRDRIESMLKEGLVREKKINNKRSFQAILAGRRKL